MISLDDINLDAVSEDDKEQVVDLHQAEAIDKGNYDGTDIDAGNESFSERFATLEKQMQNPQQAVARPSRLPFAIRTSDRVNYRVYLNSTLMFVPEVITILSRFLDTRNENETVTFILGTELNTIQAFRVNALISAVVNCRAKIIAVAAGWCSIPETMLWCFAKERVVYKYGALTFGTADCNETFPEYKPLFEIFLNKAKELNYINDEDLKSIWENNSTKFVMYEDLVNTVPDEV